MIIFKWNIIKIIFHFINVLSGFLLEYRLKSSSERPKSGYVTVSSIYCPLHQTTNREFFLLWWGKVYRGYRFDIQVSWTCQATKRLKVLLSLHESVGGQCVLPRLGRWAGLTTPALLSTIPRSGVGGRKRACWKHSSMRTWHKLIRRQSAQSPWWLSAFALIPEVQYLFSVWQFTTSPCVTIDYSFNATEFLGCVSFSKLFL